MKRMIVTCTLITVFRAFPVAAVPAELPKTGQTTLFAAGDDGDRQAGAAWPNPRFTANADTSITDNLTGLVWAPDGNIMPARDNNWDQDGTVNDGMVTWQHALDYVVKLNSEQYLGRADWRLPNVNEIDSLLHGEFTNEICGAALCGSNAFWLVARGFANVQPSYYWSSTSYVDGPMSNAWLINMNIGEGFLDQANKNNWYYVLPVRAGQ